VLILFNSPLRAKSQCQFIQRSDVLSKVGIIESYIAVDGKQEAQELLITYFKPNAQQSIPSETKDLFICSVRKNVSKAKTPTL
jgi:hypothetical protein